MDSGATMSRQLNMNGAWCRCRTFRPLVSRWEPRPPDLAWVCRINLSRQEPRPSKAASTSQSGMDHSKCGPPTEPPGPVTRRALARPTLVRPILVRPILVRPIQGRPSLVRQKTMPTDKLPAALSCPDVRSGCGGSDVESPAQCRQWKGPFRPGCPSDRPGKLPARQ